MKLCDALVEALKLLDVEYVFGVSGANIEHLHDAIHRLGGGRLRSVMARSEDGAAFMADGYARVHRKLGVCCATSGGGMLNLVAGVAEALVERVPMLAIVGLPPLQHWGRGAFQDSSGVGRTIDAQGMFAAVCKHTELVTSAAEFWPAFSRVVSLALTGPAGPTVLLLPRSVYELEVAPPTTRDIEDLRKATRGAAPSEGQLREALALLRGAQRPVLVLGEGVQRSVNPTAVIAFAERTGIPVATTFGCRGLFPNRAPNYLGSLGAAGHPSVEKYLRDVDIVVTAGVNMDAMTRAPLRKARLVADKRLIAVDVELDGLRRALAAARQGVAAERSYWPSTMLGIDLEIEHDPGLVFEGLLRLLDEEPLRIQAPCYEPTVFAPMLVDCSADTEAALLQSDALELISQSLPDGAHLVYDAGNCAAAALHYVAVPPRGTTTIALGMGGMGYSIPAAVGIQLGAEPGRRTVCFTGDGAFLMKGFELHVGVDYQLPVLWIVFNDSAHGMCVTRQRLMFEGRFECVQYGPFDASMVARAFGPPSRLWTGRATSAAQLRALLLEYWDLSPRPGLLELCLNREEIPPFAPFLGSGAIERVVSFQAPAKAS
jgi:acetolactate synthase I/II/III large subunit